MTTPFGEALQVFHAWLTEPETYAFLTRFVAMKKGQRDARNFIEDPEEEDLCHAFLLYLLERFTPGSLVGQEMIDLIRTAQFRRILELTWGRFVWQRQERWRNKDYNPRGYLYRRLREILRANDRHFTVSVTAQKILSYAPAKYVAGPGRQFPLWQKEGEVGYAHWELPPPAENQPPEKYLFSEKWLVGAADFFWRQVMERAGNPMLVPIRELCRYLAEQHPWLNRPMRHEDGEGNCLDQLADDREPPEDRLERIGGLRSVAQLAAQLVATWTEDQQLVFVLRMETPPATLEEIAKRLGLRDHNKAYGLYQKSVQSLRLFTSNWPGVPLAELPEEVAQVFIEEVQRLCKKNR